MNKRGQSPFIQVTNCGGREEGAGFRGSSETSHSGKSCATAQDSHSAAVRISNVDVRSAFGCRRQATEYSRARKCGSSAATAMRPSSRRRARTHLSPPPSNPLGLSPMLERSNERRERVIQAHNRSRSWRVAEKQQAGRERCSAPRTSAISVRGISRPSKPALAR